MLRWRLSTVRTFGGHDSNPRLSCFFNPQTLRLSRSRFGCTHVDPAIPVTNLAQELDPPLLTSSSAQSYPTDALRLSSRSSTNLTERDHCAGGCSRTTRSAIDTLRQYLSSDNVASNRPLVCSPNTIRSLYYRAESRDQLGMLDSEMLTLLIGLFGSLSADPHPSSVYRVPLASCLFGPSTRRTHWAFVLKVGKLKSRRGMPLHDSDRFWLMRAELAIAQASPPLEPLSDDAYGAILRARIHYHVIRRHTRHPEVHTHYLETLLAIRDTRLHELSARDISFLLRVHRVCHPWLQRLLYRLVIRHGRFLSAQSQEAILAALWSRICQGTDETLDLVPKNGLSSITLDLDACNSDATSIAHSISTTLFRFPGHLPNNKLANTPGHLLSVFCPAYVLPLRWNSLTLLSIFNSSEMLHVNGTHWANDYVMPQVASCWQVIFGLATVERILQDPSSALEMQGGPTEECSETTRTLHRQWSSIIKSCLISRDLACAVATSFLKIASILANSILFHNCRDLYPLKNNSKGLPTSVPNFFAAQYVAAAVRVQGPLPDVVFTALETYSPDPNQQCQVLASAVEVLSPVDAPLAYTLYTLLQANGTELGPGATHSLAVSLARRGALRHTVLFLNDARFSLEARGILLSATARSLRGNPRARPPSSVFIAVAEELVALYQSHAPPEHFRGHLEQLFVVLSQHGRGGRLLRVVLSIFRGSPGFFQPQFFGRYCRALIRHRQFSAVNKLLGAITTAHPKITRSLRIVIDRIGVQTKASRVSKRTTLRGPTSLQLSSRLRSRPLVGPLLEHSLQELLKLGRVLAAKHIFACAATRVPSSRCTTLGNILLHGVSVQPRPRNGRRVRKVLTLLEDLVKNHGFRPDRATVNILIKVMVRWRSVFDSSRLRDLFDQLVRGGLPAADYSPLRPPFGTRQTTFSGSPSFSKLPSFISFKKHSRPLFKMFIKAFYSCNDVEAARKVVGILKVEEYKNALAKEARQRARTRGRIKAAQRNVTLQDTTVP